MANEFMRRSFEISIHSLRMEGDQPNLIIFQGSGISIHSLRMEGDSPAVPTLANDVSFQSTPSAWRETCVLLMYDNGSPFQSTPSAWRETLYIL